MKKRRNIGLTLFELYEGRCALCNERIELGTTTTKEDSLTIDHIIPRSKGGTDAKHNLQPTHRRCNLTKGDNYNTTTHPIHLLSSEEFEQRYKKASKVAQEKHAKIIIVQRKRKKDKKKKKNGRTYIKTALVCSQCGVGNLAHRTQRLHTSVQLGKLICFECLFEYYTNQEDTST